MRNYAEARDPVPRWLMMSTEKPFVRFCVGWRKMIFTVLGAVAELERNLIRERVSMGISRARRQGKQLGRPKRLVDRERVLSLYAQHRSYRIVAKLSVANSRNQAGMGV